MNAAANISRWAGLAACLASASALGAPPSRATIERHVDRTINVHGHYAAVRLPLTKGPPLSNPTAIRAGADGVMVVANYPGEIVRLLDADGDGLEDTVAPFADVRRDGQRYATSLAIRGREVFVATAAQIRVYEDTDGDGVADRGRVFFEGFPSSADPAEWVFGLTFGPDGWLYFTLSTDSYNAAPAPDPNKWRGSLLRVSPDGRSVDRVATGLRNAYGMAVGPGGDLFFSDNSGGGNPTEELNWVRKGAFYGHDPEKWPGHPPATPPLVAVHYGYGLTGIAFNPATNDFGGTAGDCFVGAWGPDFLWDRGSVSRVHLERNPDGTYRAEEFPFAHEVPKVGDVCFGPQGDLYVARFGKEGHGHVPFGKPEGGVYRFVHAPWFTPPPPSSPFPRIKGDLAHGRQVFEKLGCAACHEVGGKAEMLGPDLAGLGEMFTEKEVLTAIREPSAAIKSGHEGVGITLRDGESVTGRIVRSDPDAVVVLQAGNTRRTLPRATIAATTPMAASLMPAGLLDASTPSDVEDLLAYLGVRRPSPWQRVQMGVVSGFRKWRTGTSRNAKLLEGAALAALVAGLAWRVARRRAVRRPASPPSGASGAPG